MKPTLDWLTDPTVFRVNQLPAHSDHVCFRSEAEIAAGVSSLRRSLNGSWKFVWSPNPGVRPAEFWQEDFDVSGWADITVPGHIQMQGWGQRQYVNVQYPWDGRKAIRPPEIDWEDAPVGSYVTFFDVPEAWAGERVCVSFQGAEAALYLWCNGQFVGYAEDSFTPSDFDLTPYIKETGNRLCAEVHQRCSASWIEDQDFFRFSGLFRDVFLYAKPIAHIEDIWLKTQLEGEKGGVLTPIVELSGDYEHTRLFCRVDGPDESCEYELLGHSGDDHIHFEEVALWDYGSPNLYRVTLTLTDEAGQVLEVVPYRVGFRKFELADGILQLNGRRVVFRGVNRHEWNPSKGRAIDEADMVSAMEVIRKNHINAVRTSHYPNQSRWYDLCDENGIYLIDETNLESHGCWAAHMGTKEIWDVPGSDLKWRDCVVDRARNMFQRDKNHVSILFWSCGNESYMGENILEMSRYFHSHDDTRLVHYEGVWCNRALESASDVESRMYPDPWDVRSYLENDPKKPYIQCEYMHNMGNSLGGMESYIRLNEEFPQSQGGFIWDYMDQALWLDTPRGVRELGYGGDFGERPTDYAFCGNGLVFADGSEKPAVQEVRYWYDTPENRARHDAANVSAAAVSSEKLAGELAARPRKPLRVEQGDNNLGVFGENFEVIFSSVQAGPVSLKIGGTQWLYRAPRPAFWRASTDNDRGNNFVSESAVWMGADMAPMYRGFEVLNADETQVKIVYHFAVAALPGVRADVTYTVQDHGVMTVEASYHGSENAPELPCFGLRFLTPAPVEQTGWTGLSGETYPDRFKGGIFGCHTEIPHITPHLVPQDCGCHYGTHQIQLKQPSGSLIIQMADDPFTFSALPNTPMELESALHQSELPQTGRTTVTILGPVRGVGGINSWGRHPEEPYHVDGRGTHRVKFCVLL